MPLSQLANISMIIKGIGITIKVVIATISPHKIRCFAIAGTGGWRTVSCGEAPVTTAASSRLEGCAAASASGLAAAISCGRIPWLGDGKVRLPASSVPGITGCNERRRRSIPWRLYSIIRCTVRRKSAASNAGGELAPPRDGVGGGRVPSDAGCIDAVERQWR